VRSSHFCAFSFGVCVQLSTPTPPGTCPNRNPEPTTATSPTTSTPHSTGDASRPGTRRTSTRCRPPCPGAPQRGEYRQRGVPRVDGACRVGASVIKHGHDPYKNQPGRIENYIPGHSSISEKEAKEVSSASVGIFGVPTSATNQSPEIFLVD
jgi:hypothetical protein